MSELLINHRGDKVRSKMLVRPKRALRILSTYFEGNGSSSNNGRSHRPAVYHPRCLPGPGPLIIVFIDTGSFGDLFDCFTNGFEKYGQSTSHVYNHKINFSFECSFFYFDSLTNSTTIIVIKVYHNPCLLKPHANNKAEAFRNKPQSIT